MFLWGLLLSSLTFHEIRQICLFFLMVGNTRKKVSAMSSSNQETMNYEEVTRALDDLVCRKSIHENYKIVRTVLNKYFDIVENQNGNE